MKYFLFFTFLAVAFFGSLKFAYAEGTIVTDIKNANIVCFHISKSEALVFKTSQPQKVWKTLQDSEGKVKTKNALQLGLSKMNLLSDLRSIESFNAYITEGYRLNGTFESGSDGELALSVTSTYLPDGDKSNVTDQYNCSKVKN